MSQQFTNSYDVVVYNSHSRYSTHPDCLATMATLLGLDAASVDRCRVLELGCATGGNLLPMAEALPGSQFVGIDLSPRQIDIGQKVAAAMGLHNLRLEARSILDVEPSFGTFDYIICHGVYSWVPEKVRDKILSICRHNLAPGGVAYVSYNTLPGWHLRAPVREMMLYHVRDVADPREWAAQARSGLEFLIRAAPEPDGLWAQLLREEAKLVREREDHYIVHEHLEEENHPVYFHQFVEQARAHGLQYLAEAQVHTPLSSFPPEVQETLRNLSDDLIQLEQYMDFLRNRQFRRTLLVHAEEKVVRAARPEVVSSLYAAALARPMSEQPDVCSQAVEEFRNAEAAVSTNNPLTKAALVELAEAWPRALPFEEVCTAARRRLGTTAADLSALEARQRLAPMLVQLFLSNLVGLHVHAPSFVTRRSDRPRTTPLIQFQARTGAPVVNRLHREVPINALDRAVLSVLDGNRDRRGVVQAVAESVRGRRLDLRGDGQALTDPAEARAAVDEGLDACLGRLGKLAVLVG
jgi:methyltransferase-like protein/SAM-dependent methyltransferase